MLRLNPFFYIIKKRKDFVKISKTDVKWMGNGFIAQIEKTDSNTNRIGFTVTKRVSKKAVIRNKIKRKLRELARKHLRDNIKTGFDIVLIGTKKSELVSFKDMEDSLKFCIKKLDLKK